MRGGGVFAEAGQMVVELCVVMPVALMVSIVVIDMLVFAAECSRFDHLAPQAVLSVAGAPLGTEFDPDGSALAVEQALGVSFDKGSIGVETSYDGRICQFLCEYSSAPWPLDAGGGVLFGLTAPLELSHKCQLAARPYVIGEI